MDQNSALITQVGTWLGTGSLNIFGMQLSGKDTQGAALSKLFNGPLLGGGDILRNSVIPPRAQAALDVGDLVDTQDYVDIVLPYLSKSEFIGKPLILSALGRWIGEEKNVLAATEAAGHPTKAVIYLDITEEEALRRLSVADRGRADDHEENLRHRLKEFRNKTLPVLEEYRKLGLLININGMKTPERITEDILNQLNKRASA